MGESKSGLPFDIWFREIMAEVWKSGFDAGQESAYIGHFDQYDRGSLMFREAPENPYRGESDD